MAGPVLTAHAFVACRSVQWDGPAGPNTSRTLEQVSYTYRTDVTSGFPYETELWLFVRLPTTVGGSLPENSGSL